MDKTAIQNVIRYFQTIDLSDIKDIAIAGGAIRDYLLGIDIKDVDIFITKEDWELLFPHLIDLNIEPALDDDEFDPAYDNTAYKCRVYKSSIYGVPVDFIVLKDISVREAIKRFPVAISQVGIHLKERRFVFTKLARADYSDDTFTWNSDIEGKTSEYINRIYKKVKKKRHWKLNRKVFP